MSKSGCTYCKLGGNRENSVGYCKLHLITVTAKQMKTRQCLEKHCRHFQKWGNHPYWASKAGEDKKRAEHKAAIKAIKADRKLKEKEDNLK